MLLLLAETNQRLATISNKAEPMQQILSRLGQVYSDQPFGQLNNTIFASKMDSLLSSIQGQYLSAVASSLSRAIVQANNGKRRKHSSIHGDNRTSTSREQFKLHQEATPSSSQTAAQSINSSNLECQQISPNSAVSNRRKAQVCNTPSLQTTKPLDLTTTSMRAIEVIDDSRCTTTTKNSFDGNSLLFPLNLVTKNEMQMQMPIASPSSSSLVTPISRLITSSTTSPSSISPTSSLSSTHSSTNSSSRYSAALLSGDFETSSSKGVRKVTTNALQSNSPASLQHRKRSSNKKVPKGTKSHLCNHCGRSFSRSDMLTRHSRLHSGLKPYQCAKCLQVFSRSDHLSTHERTHTGEKPYQCNFCSYSACRRDMITRHMRTHTIRTDSGASTKATLTDRLPEVRSQVKFTNRTRRNNIDRDQLFEKETGSIEGQKVPIQNLHNNSESRI